MASSSLAFAVEKCKPVLVAPAKPTPRELKPLSDIDDQKGLRFHVSGIHFYPNNPLMSGTDPARIVREALAEALVFYYPLAGRLLEMADGKLVVNCTGEGATFVEAYADVELAQFGPNPQPPFPCLEDLVYEAPGKGFLDSPLISIQVTRLKCGGFIFAHRINHAVADAAGTVQFVKAMSELARGADTPSVLPVWARELLAARDPPIITHSHPEYDEIPSDVTSSPTNMAFRMFFFGSKEMSALRRRIPENLRSSTRFELLTACLWRCRSIAMNGEDDEEVRLRFVLNARDKCNPPLPVGFYGNGFAYAVTRSTVGELRRNPLGYALELVRAAKRSITDGYLHSVADFLVSKGRPHYTTARTYRVSDLTRLGFEDVEFGWGSAVYCGPAVGGGRLAPRGGSYYVRYRDGILVPVSLPEGTMEKFEGEIERMTMEIPAVVIAGTMKEETCGSLSPFAVPSPRAYQLVNHV